MSNGPNRNKRRYPRRSVVQKAQLKLAAELLLPCEIRDFCRGGLLLMPVAGEAWVNHPEARLGGQVTILFTPNHSASPFALRGAIAHVSEQGLGIAFVEQAPVAALAALQERAESLAHTGQVGQRPPGATADLDTIAKACRRALQDLLEPVLEDFFREVDAALVEVAGKALVNTEQAIYFEAQALLKSHHTAIESQFCAQVLKQAEGFVAAVADFFGAGSTASGLSLVEQGEFEDWLNLSAEIARAECLHADDLQRIERRFSHLAGKEINRKNNPYGPGSIQHSFRAALHDLPLQNAAKQVIYRVFGEVLDPRLRNLYQHLEEVTSPLAPPDGARAPGNGSAPASAAVDTGLGAAGATGDAQTETPAAGPAGSSEAEAPVAAAMANPAGVATPLGGNVAIHSPTRPTPYAAAATLISLCSEQRGQDEESGASAAASTLHDIASIMSALQRLQARKAAQHVDYLETPALEAELLQDLSASGASPGELTGVPKQTIEVLGGLFDKVVGGDWIPSGVKPYVQALQIPLLEAALKDPQLLHGESHPARDVINLLDRLALATNSGGEIEDSRLRQALERLSARIVRDAVDQPTVFSEAKAQLEQLTEPLLKARRVRLARLQEVCEADRRMERARRSVDEAIDAKLGGKSVPVLLIKLLNAGWRQLLILTVLREGMGAPAWEARFAVLDHLMRWLRPDGAPCQASALDAHRLIAQVDEELRKVCAEPLALNRILLELTASLLGRSDTGERKVPKFVNVPVLAQAGEDAQREEVAREKLKALQVGDWLDFTSAAGVRKPLRLSWIGENPHRYVFADSKGRKQLDLNARQFARYLHEGKALVVEDKELPLLERATSQLVQSMQEKLRFEATHDAVTGLINRREFMRELQGRCNVGGAARHFLCMLDLAQLRVINQLCGMEAGDRLLKEVCVILRRCLSGDHLLARLGDSSFGLLLGAGAHDQHRKKAEELLQAIAEHHFKWGERSFTVTVNLGMASMALDMGSPEVLLKNADAACMAAKQKGPNRIQIYKADDVSLEAQQQMMDWAGRIDNLLAQDRLFVRCQRIAPIFPERDAHSHYEVLLGIHSEDGDEVSPFELVVAAERWFRASDIDRWQIQSVFRWIEEHQASFEQIGGFSINLSGQSLNSESFLEFLHAQLLQGDVPAEKITFEITETAAIGEFAHAGQFIRQIKRHGCRFSLDDFGSGFSSYAYLKNLQVDYLKIDGSFVKDLASSSKDYALVKSMNEIGHSLGIKTIAEYVESEAILEKLREIGVDYAQGYLVGKPSRIVDLVAYAAES